MEIELQLAAYSDARKKVIFTLNQFTSFRPGSCPPIRMARWQHSLSILKWLLMAALSSCVGAIRIDA